MASSESKAYLRGLVGARLANKDNWVFVIGGSKAFVHFFASSPMPRFEGGLVVAPHPLVASNIAGHSELWVMVVACLKGSDAEVERAEMTRLLRAGGYEKRISPAQDILIILEPEAPKWAGRLIANYVQWICTGEGETEVSA